MRQKKYLKADRRKAKILFYIEKQPLSTVREIADNYHTHKSNFKLVKNSVDELLNENKVGKIFKSTECYFVNPSKNEGKDILVKIVKSEKIFQNRFKKISRYDYHYGWPPPFSEIVRRCINLFHLRLKILLIETRRQSRQEITNEQFRRIQKEHQSNFIGFITDYSPNKFSVLGPAISRRGEKSFIETKNPTQEQRFIFLSNYLSAKNINDERYYKLLISGSKSLGEKLDLMSIWLRTGNIRNAADLHGTTNQNIRRILSHILKDGNFSLFQVIMPLLAEEGRTLMPKVSSSDMTRVFLQSIVRSNASLLKTSIGRRKLSNNSKKLLGFDILKQVDWKSFDIS